MTVDIEKRKQLKKDLNSFLRSLAEQVSMYPDGVDSIPDRMTSFVYLTILRGLVDTYNKLEKTDKKWALVKDLEEQGDDN